MTRKIFTLAFLVALVAILTGCGSYWKAQGDAVRDSAIARRTLAQEKLEVAQGNSERDRLLAQGQLEAAKGNRALIEAQANILANNANMPMVVIGFAGLAILLISGLAAIAIWYRSPVPQQTNPVINVTLPPGLVDPRRAGLRLETPTGIVMLEPEPGETRRQFINRCEITAQLLGAGDWQRAGRRLLTDGQ